MLSYCTLFEIVACGNGTVGFGGNNQQTRLREFADFRPQKTIPKLVA